MLGLKTATQKEDFLIPEGLWNHISKQEVWKERVRMEAIQLPKRIDKWETQGLVELTRINEN